MLENTSRYINECTEPNVLPLFVSIPSPSSRALMAICVGGKVSCQKNHIIMVPYLDFNNGLCMTLAEVTVRNKITLQSIDHITRYSSILKTEYSRFHFSLQRKESITQVNRTATVRLRRALRTYIAPEDRESI